VVILKIDVFITGVVLQVNYVFDRHYLGLRGDLIPQEEELLQLDEEPRVLVLGDFILHCEKTAFKVIKLLKLQKFSSASTS
jgi:hypothetical protein